MNADTVSDIVVTARHTRTHMHATWLSDKKLSDTSREIVLNWALSIVLLLYAAFNMECTCVTSNFLTVYVLASVAKTALV